MREHRPLPQGVWIGVALALVAGAALRLAWGGDVEFKYDEHWLFEHALVRGSGAFPGVGMRSSVGILNPGLSVWVFVVLARVTGAVTPIDLARAVQILNILALAAVALFALAAVEPREREAWMWGVALASVNPMAIVLARKIWQQSVLPVFTALVLVGWWNRGKPWGALWWGVAGACVGQVHAAGFFMTAGLVAWAFLFDRRSVRWRWWMAGAAAGLLPLVPWLLYVAGGATAAAPGAIAVLRLLELRYWLFWALEPLGLGLWASLGDHFTEFLATGPWYAVGILHITAVVLGLTLYAVVVARARQEGWSRFPVGADRTAFTTNAACIGCGVLMTASMAAIHPSYLNAVFPLQFVWLAYLLLGGAGSEALKRLARRALTGLCLVEVLISASFLQYIHVRGGAPGADYGVAYSAQPPGQTFKP